MARPPGLRPPLVAGTALWLIATVAAGAQSRTDTLQRADGCSRETASPKCALPVFADTVGPARDDSAAFPARSFAEVLRARAAGVRVRRNSGMTTGGATIEMRGPLQSFGHLEPLVIVDGVPLATAGRSMFLAPVGYGSRLEDILPEHVESIEFLRGAATNALYGTRGAGGVIVVRTRRPAGPGVRWRAYLGGGAATNAVTYPDRYQLQGVTPGTSTPRWCDLQRAAAGDCTVTGFVQSRPLAGASAFRAGTLLDGGVSLDLARWGGGLSLRADSRQDVGPLGADESRRRWLSARWSQQLPYGLSLDASITEHRLDGLRSDLDVLLLGALGLPHVPDDLSLRVQQREQVRRRSAGAQLRWEIRPWLSLWGSTAIDRAGEAQVQERLRPPAPPVAPWDTLPSTRGGVWRLGEDAVGATLRYRLPLGVEASTELLRRSSRQRREAYEQAYGGGIWMERWVQQRTVALVQSLRRGALRIEGGVGREWRSMTRSADGPALVTLSIAAPTGVAGLTLEARYGSGRAHYGQLNSEAGEPEGVINFYNGQYLVSVWPDADSRIEREAAVRWSSARGTVRMSYVSQTSKLPLGINFSHGARLAARGVELEGTGTLLRWSGGDWSGGMIARFSAARVRDFYFQGYLRSPFLEYAGASPLTLRGIGPGTWVDADGDGLPEFSEIASDGEVQDLGAALPNRDIGVRSALRVGRVMVSTVIEHLGGQQRIGSVGTLCSFALCRAWQDPSTSNEERVAAFSGGQLRPSAHVEDGSFTRIHELALRLDLTGAPMLSGARGAGLTLSARNLATFGGGSSTDPELWNGFVNGGAPPQPYLMALPRTLSARLDVAF